MNETTKVMSRTILLEIEKATNILLHLHPSPDGDSVGSALAMMMALELMGKKVTLISGDSNPPSTLAALPGFEKIINRPIGKTDLGEYQLFLILDSASMTQVTRKTTLEIPEGLMTIVIDHHGTNPRFGKINLVEKSYPATSQIVYDLLKEWNVSLNTAIASCLYMGIYTDTGGFKYPPTSADTLAAAADLARYSTDFTRLIFSIENNNSEGRIRYLGLALSQIECFYQKNLAISAVTQEQLKRLSIATSDTEKADISNILKSVVGWNIGACLTEVENGSVNVSLRTRDAKRFDVSKLAVALGGGGHPAAAGGTINLPLAEAKALLIKKAGEVYLELSD